MKNKLITGLRSAANALEQDTFFYNWSKPAHCNCGSLFCALTGKSASELAQLIPPSLYSTTATWKTRIGQHCPITGLPTQELFKELFGYGLTAKDMINLEFLSDEKVVARMDLHEMKRVAIPSRRNWYQLIPSYTCKTEKVQVKVDYTNKLHAIAYMRAWAALLAEESAMDIAAPDMQETLV